MNTFNFDQVRQAYSKTQIELPLRLAKQAEKHFAESFSNGRLDEYGWKEVQRRIPGTKAWKYKPKGVSLNAHRSNPILVQTGNLRRKVNRSIRSIRPDMIRLVVDLPYAKRHNEGLDNIPARPFMKQTRILTNMQNDLITKTIDKIWRGQ